jgi:hypothetical protein
MTFGLIALTDFRVETADTAKARRSGNRTLRRARRGQTFDGSCETSK